MILSENDRQGLADLKSMPAYLLLMEVLREHENGVLDAMAATIDRERIVWNATYFQFVRTVRKILQSTPEQAFEELATARQLMGDSEMSPLTREQLWQQRWNTDPDPSAT